jgi:hypothetical protein
VLATLGDDCGVGRGSEAEHDRRFQVIPWHNARGVNLGLLHVGQLLFETRTCRGAVVKFELRSASPPGTLSDCPISGRSNLFG